MSNNNTTITWEYAKNFDTHEQRWQEMLTNCQKIIGCFTKHTVLQMTFSNQYYQLLDMVIAIREGDRSEFLYKRTKEMIVDVTRLKDVATALETFYQQR